MNTVTLTHHMDMFAPASIKQINMSARRYAQGKLRWPPTCTINSQHFRITAVRVRGLVSQVRKLDGTWVTIEDFASVVWE